MPYQDMFTTSDWETLQYGPLWVFRSVAGADGNIDQSEQAAFKKIAANPQLIKNELAKEIIESIAPNLGVMFRKSISDQRDFKTGLQELSGILLKNRVDPYVSLAFKKTLIAMGFFVANISGEPYSEKSTNVSGEEANVLRQISMKLGLNMNELRESPTIQEIMEDLATKEAL